MADIYTVTSQVTEEELTPRGTFQKVITVYYASKQTDFTGFVRIPVERYSPQAVDDAIRAELTPIHETHAL